jgi:hypothetical protein
MFQVLPELIDDARLFCNQKQTKNYNNNGKTPADVYYVLPDEWIEYATFLQQQKKTTKTRTTTTKTKTTTTTEEAINIS